MTINKITYVDAYSGYIGFSLDIDKIEERNSFICISIEIRKAPGFSIDKFLYLKPKVYFHIYNKFKKNPEISKYQFIHELEWEDLKKMINGKTVWQIKKNLACVKIIAENKGWMIPDDEMRIELEKQIKHNGLEI